MSSKFPIFVRFLIPAVIFAFGGLRKFRVMGRLTGAGVN